ncbi:HigA protein (Antitoxin to HigB) [Magnetospirillum sp. LM-5]|uniref:HigA family addiction module antitoxin n=1 Tax=Magnetospirillum sp. LM-5 TaxID=2681466 RepID=UPI001380FFBB|nr:HigA family addiction module antitoxin [Magnetospirillum sp. LM-5]CAA7615322.1 HigA protein (Antitoxin to HigB) [Magnetospirillum sp. LM-5]
MTSAPSPRRTRCPAHPGRLLQDVVLPELRLSITDAAAQLRISRQTLHRILAGKAAITPEMAVRLGKFCGNGPGLWLRMQQAHDLWLAEQAMAEEIAHIPGHGRAA